MKNLMIAALFAATPTFAAPPSPELRQVTRALLNNVDIVEKLQKNNSTNLFEVEITEEKQGVNHYLLKFNRDCFCLPSTAIVKIREDMTPTYRDGPIEYSSSIEIKDGSR
jgi:hypothetical protein